MDKDHVLFNNKGSSRGVSRVLQPRQVPVEHLSLSSLQNVHIRWPQITSMPFSCVVSTKFLPSLPTIKQNRIIQRWGMFDY